MTERFHDLSSDETEVGGVWSDAAEQANTHARIEWLTTSRLKRVAFHPVEGAWSTLYWDPADGRYWEKTYPYSAYHGGGPALLRVISADEARITYRLESSTEPTWPVAVVGDDNVFDVYARLADIAINIEPPALSSCRAIDAAGHAFTIEMDPPASRFGRALASNAGYQGPYRLVPDGQPVEPDLAARAREAMAPVVARARERDLIRKLVTDLHLTVAERRSLTGGRARLSLLVEVVSLIIQETGSYPAGADPTGAWDGAIAFDEGGVFAVHWRHEVGQLRYETARIDRFGTVHDAARAIVRQWHRGHIDGVPIDETG